MRMPEEPSSQPDRAGSNRTDAHPPMPRDKRGWHVAPAPGGRVIPEQAPSGPPVHRRPSFLWFVLALIAINWLSVLFFQPTASESRVRIPFSPSFLAAVDAGHVKSFSSKGDTVQGRYTMKERFPHTDSKATPTKLFATEVPSFWNDTQLSALLKEKHVEINAKPT